MANNMVSCRGCGKEIHNTAATCPQCGAPQRTKRYKSKIAAGVLALFTGGFGIHRFYLGQWWGIFYLLFFWLWIPGLIAFIEGLVFLFTDDEKWDKKYNEGIPGKGEGSAALVVALVAGVIFFVAFIGILAAIAIPAYQDYTIRAKVAAAMAAGEPAKGRVGQYVLNKRIWPTSNSEIALQDKINEKHIESLSVGNGGAITIRFSQDLGPAAAKTIVLVPRVDAGQLVWSCTGGTLAAKYRAPDCREGTAR
jgi:TM2 domain-containing membrane protein YozV/Tfp pilus assembly protein PilE